MPAARPNQKSTSNPATISTPRRPYPSTRIRGRCPGITLAFQGKGYRFITTPAEADLLLSWHLVTQHKTDVRTYQTPTYGAGYGYRYNRYSMYNCWSCRPTQTEVSVRDYTQGTFIVDLIDPKLKQSVWRGTTESRLKGEVEQDQGKYNEAALAIFASFPP